MGSTLADIRQKTLPNGLRVIVRPDPSTPIVALNFWVRVGSNNETDDLMGWSHGIEHMLFKGTARRPTGAIAREIQDLGGETNAGTGYEIATFPIRAQRGCTGVTATYTVREDGEIDVFNRCRKYALDGPEDSVSGRARVVDEATNARLEVSFFRPFWGDYWIIDLAPDYSYAVVGHPSRDYLWILARTPQLPEETYAGIVKRIEEKGYPLDRLVRTLQAPAKVGSAP